MTETSETRLKRLHMRAWRRGMREMDLILGGFADAGLEALAPGELDLFEALLGENDQELYAWVSQQTPVPAPYAALIRRIRAFHHMA